MSPEPERDVRLRYDSAPARRERILDLVRERGFCNVNELAAALTVSEMTVRRDFRHLARLGLVRQVHGGISALTTVAGPIDFRLRAVEGQEAKRSIAQHAVGLLESGSVIALDAGTTTLEVARSLPEDMRLTVVTHSLPAMGALASRGSVEVIGLGGQLHSDTQAFAGAITVQMIRDIRVSTALIAATAVRDGAMWCTNTFDAETKQALIKSADRVILLADSSKFEATAVMRVTDLEAVDVLITDSEIDPKIARSLKPLGVELVVVPD